MIYTNDRHAYRQFFYTAWQKHLKNLSLSPIEAELVQILLCHPEYHRLLESKHSLAAQEFQPEENPFIHLSLHQAIREQLKLDRPAGVKQIYDDLLDKLQDPHLAEHQIMTCLAQIVWQAQREGVELDEESYLAGLKAGCKVD